MDDREADMSRVVDGVSRAMAEWAINRHLDRDDTLPERYGRDWRSDWSNEIRYLISVLAQAIAVRRPEVFAAAVTWSGEAFAARSIGSDDLLTSLACLRDVFESEMPETIANLARTYVDAALKAVDQRPVPGTTEPRGPAGPHREKILLYLEAILQGDRRRAEAVVLGAVESGTTVPTVYLEILAPALVEIGQMWHLGEISIADEHHASATTAAVMVRLRATCPDPTPRNRTVLTASPAGETHEIGVRMVADFLEMDGWRVIDLGGNIPATDVVRSLLDHEASLLAASVTHCLHLRSMGELIDSIRATEDIAHLPVIVGGAPFRMVADLWRELGADGCAATPPAAVKLANDLVAESVGDRDAKTP